MNNSLELYEDALIKDCFGVERLLEYKGLGKLEALLVYAIPVGCLQPAPGGRDNAMVVSKNIFQDLSLPDHEGNYFLDPSGVLGAFHISPLVPPKCTERTQALAEEEHINDVKIQLAIRKAKLSQASNVDEATRAAFAVGGTASAATLDIMSHGSRTELSDVDVFVGGIGENDNGSSPSTPKSPKLPNGSPKVRSLFSAAGSGGAKQGNSGGVVKLSKLETAAISTGRVRGVSMDRGGMDRGIGGSVDRGGVEMRSVNTSFREGGWKEMAIPTSPRGPPPLPSPRGPPPMPSPRSDRYDTEFKPTNQTPRSPPTTPRSPPTPRSINQTPRSPSLTPSTSPRPRPAPLGSPLGVSYGSPLSPRKMGKGGKGGANTLRYPKVSSFKLDPPSPSADLNEPKSPRGSYV